MSFGFSAATWVAIGAVGISATTAAVSADSQRKAIHGQQDAAKAAQAQDAIDTASAQTNATLTANTKLASDRRARQANVLALGGTGTNSGSTLGTPANVLAGGVKQQSSVLGGGAPGAF